MNRDCVVKGGSTAKDMAQYRQTNEMRVKKHEGHKKDRHGQRVDEAVTFGVRNRPSTPIKNVVCNMYGAAEEELKREKELVMKVLR
jgi:hypothetical protein